jgi:RNA polymerase sigma-70 factor (ECF subfamily)
VAANEVRNVLRSQRRDRLRFDDELVVALAEDRVKQIEEHDERFEALQGCLAGLKPADHQLVQAAYFGGQTLAVHAESTGRSLQTLYNRLSQLRRQLWECVERKRAARERFA